MTDEELYEFSKNLKIFGHYFEELKQKHVFQYHMIVNFSEQKFKCGQAKYTKHFMREEDEDLVELMDNFMQAAGIMKEIYLEQVVGNNDEKENKSQ